jgi:thiosulfate dehydrogenase
MHVLRHWFVLWVIPWQWLWASGCTQSARDWGRELVDDPSVSDSASNAFRCTTCHELTASPTHLRPGYTLSDSAVRATYWGGFVLDLLGAINQCYVNFMRGPELPPTDDRARAIRLYLLSISPDASQPALPLTVVQNIVDLPSGDPVAGKRLYDDGCGRCHGPPHTGDGRLGKATIIPDDTLRDHGTDRLTGTRPVTIEKARHGKFFNVGGNMPLYSLERLSDAQLGQILGYLEQFGMPPMQ